MNSTISYKLELGAMLLNDADENGNEVYEPCWILYEYLHYAGIQRSKVMLASMPLENGAAEIQTPALERWQQERETLIKQAIDEGELPEVNFKLC